jgi:predicted O-methyltransferase YrrM
MNKKQVLAQLGFTDAFENFKPRPDAQLTGWNGDRPFLGQIVHQLRPHLIIEVGSWLGLSATNFALHLKKFVGAENASLICIDTWLGSLEHWVDLQSKEWGNWMRLENGRPALYEYFLSNMIKAEVADVITPIPLPSQIGARLLAAKKITAPLIYIDGSHDEKDIYDDLVAYWPLVESGGVAFGDDWPWDSVKAGVNKFAKDYQTEVALSEDRINWLVMKP